MEKSASKNCASLSSCQITFNLKVILVSEPISRFRIPYVYFTHLFIMWLRNTWSLDSVGGSAFSVFSVSITVFGSILYISLFICLCVSNTLSSENQTCLIIILAWSASLLLVVLNLPNYSPMSLILFLLPLSWVAVKIALKSKFFLSS